MDLKLKKDSSRIGYIDGLRAVAILSVIAYHYNRYTLPGYGDILNQPLTEFGAYGVQLFFMVSGYVIAMTIERCGSWKEFLVRRFARLWPNMLLCSVITFVVINTLATRYKASASLYDFLPSLTIIQPKFYNILVGRELFDWVDGVYWTLAIEVKFYIIYCVLYWFAKKNIVTVFFVYTFVAALLYVVMAVIFPDSVSRLFDFIFAARHMPWFFVGICTYAHRNGYPTKRSIYAVTLALVAISLVAIFELDNQIIPRPLKILTNVVVFSLWCCAYRYPIVQRVLSFKVMTAIGAASYSLYLLHQEIGIKLIYGISDYFKFVGYQVLGVAIMVAGFMTVISYGIYLIYEKPINSFLVNKFFPKKNAGGK